MHRRLLLVALLAASARAKPDVPDPGVAACKARRAKLAKYLGRDYALVLGQPLTDVMNPRQEGHFLYLTGVEDHNAFLLMGGRKASPLKLSSASKKKPGKKRDPKAKRKTKQVKAREIIFLRDFGPNYAQFHGLLYQPGPASAQALGVEVTLGAPRGSVELGLMLAKALPRKAHLHLPAYRGSDHALVREIRRVVAETLADKRKDVRIVDLHKQLSAQRSIKDPYEIGLLTQAIAITHKAFRAALREIRPGSTEGAVDGALLAVVRRENARPAYPFVVGSGSNAAIPHYFRNDGPLDDGEMLVIDAGAAYRRYAADVTRTFPVGGRFKARQRECYEVVLAAQLAAIREVKPGATFAQVHQAARNVIARAGLAKYFIHGTSHHVGLDVHDPGPRILKQGMTFTVEPGIYIPAERIGARVEDIVLVTEHGHRILGEPFPKSVEEIEALLAKG